MPDLLCGGQGRLRQPAEMVRAGAGGGGAADARLAAVHLPVSARRYLRLAHPDQHADAVDVRARTGTGVGKVAVPALLLFDGYRRGFDQRDRENGSLGVAPGPQSRFYPTIGASGAI